MKKIISIITILTLTILLILSGNIYAEKQPNEITVDVDKTTVRPGETVKVTVSFEKQLGAYTFDIKYDNNIFDYQSVEGGEPNDNQERVRVVYYDSTGGTSSRSNMSVTFKAKEEITTSNPTGFKVSSSGLSTSDTSTEYEDIATPIEKTVLVEPEYVPYTLKLQNTGNIIVGEEVPITISYSSAMGRYYDKARLTATATTPDGADVKLLATDLTRSQYDIIESGWGDEQGFKIGGADVEQILQTTGIFSEAGEYTIKLSLIDRGNSDQPIAEQTFQLLAQTEATQIATTDNGETIANEETPASLPKTGINIYIPIITILVVIISVAIYLNKKNNNKV